MMLERHDIMHATELFDLSKEDRAAHLRKIRGESINEWLNYELKTDILERNIRIRTKYHAE